MTNENEKPRAEPQKPEAETPSPTHQEDLVDESIEESFPASDPPAHHDITQ